MCGFDVSCAWSGKLGLLEAKVVMLSASWEAMKRQTVIPA